MSDPSLLRWKGSHMADARDTQRELEAGRNPERFLRLTELEQEHDENRAARGELRIFFGYAAGVGKTYAMLRAAHDAQKHGVDVVIGYVEPHPRPETAALLEGLKVIPTHTVEHHGIKLQEMDLDAVLARSPQLVLVDEFAHTNAPGSRHLKRYQDVEELLQAGIDVFTTLNVQHLESLNDRVAAITGVLVTERVPDHVFDDAAQVSLVDIEPSELLERLREGRIYQGEGANRALSNFFDEKNLTALREIALRRCADRVNRMVDRVRASGVDSYYTGEHVLACLSGAPSNGRIIRTAARMAQAFSAEFTALLVRAPGEDGSGEEDTDDNGDLVRENMALAEQLGAKVEVVYGDDVAQQVSDYARMAGVSKVVLGHSASRPRGLRLLTQRPLTDRIAELSPDLDIYVIPDVNHATSQRRPRKANLGTFTTRSTLLGIATLAVITFIGMVLETLGFTQLDIGVLFVFGILVMSAYGADLLPCLAFSAFSVFAFNYFFTDPRYSLEVIDPHYLITFVVMFLTALMSSSLARRLRDQAGASAATTWRTQVLLECNQKLQRTTTSQEVVEVMCAQLIKLLHRDVVWYAVEGKTLAPAELFGVDGLCEVPTGSGAPACLSEAERGVATWVFKNNKHAGATTGTLGNAACLYLAVRSGDVIYGVVGIVMGNKPMDATENGITLSILGEAALAFENERAISEREEATVEARNEQLRANLLRSVSHDLRTPLTSISGNASVLLDDAAALPPARRRALVSDIYDDAMWLDNLVENLLAMTKFEQGAIKLDPMPELVDEVVDEALRHVSRDVDKHEVEVVRLDDLVVANMDARLIMQVIVNLVNNAIQHTPDGTHIRVTIASVDQMAQVSVADDGPGISDADKPFIFDEFYVGGTGVADSRRGTGLGLALSKSIVEAHGGTIELFDNVPHGAVFRFSLPSALDMTEGE